MLDQHRISLEPRSGIWLMFYETLVSPYRKIYRQQLLRLFKNLDTAKEAAILEFRKRQISAPLIIRDNSQKNEMFRKL